jgi:hypothetical protein
LCKPYKSGSPAPVTLAVSFINLKLGNGCLRSKNTAHESAQKLNTKNNRLIEEKKEANLCKAHLS